MRNQRYYQCTNWCFRVATFSLHKLHIGEYFGGVYSFLSFNSSSAFPPNIVSFDDVIFIGSGQFRISFTYLVIGVITYGSRNVNLIYRDLPVTPEECCFDTNIADDVMAMVNEHLNGSLQSK
ncbi:MAG: hypothetical protein IPL25_19175 [Saprospiraceae bacterium]|nr:hypothetical protein [Candidatus Vicinibacter affinis]